MRSVTLEASPGEAEPALVRALILCDLAAVAQSYVEASPGPYERGQRLAQAAVALGQAGRLPDAVGVAR